MLTRQLLKPAGLEADEANGDAVTLPQRFGSAANLYIHLYCLVLDSECRRCADRKADFVEVRDPTDEAPQTVLHEIVTRALKLLVQCGALAEAQESTYLADTDADLDDGRTLRPWHASPLETTRYEFDSPWATAGRE